MNFLILNLVFSTSGKKILRIGKNKAVSEVFPMKRPYSLKHFRIAASITALLSHDQSWKKIKSDCRVIDFGG
jgi:hypothetical protein